MNRGERDLSTLDGLPSLNAAQPLSRAGGKLFCGTGLALPVPVSDRLQVYCPIWVFKSPFLSPASADLSSGSYGRNLQC